jgi:ketosteroid isomerase-like protein
LLGSTATAQDLAAIEQLHQRDVAAAKAGDTATLATLWTDDAVALPPGEQPVVGIDVIREWPKKRPGEHRKT